MNTPMTQIGFYRALVAAIGLVCCGGVGCESPSPGSDTLVGDIDADGSELRQCERDSACRTGEFCRRTECDAPTGVCSETPQSCTSLESPVCGCNSETYSNACFAAAAGMNVAVAGQCGRGCEPLTCPPDALGVDTNGDGCPDVCDAVEAGFCQTHADCDSDQFCSGQCRRSGRCEPRPQSCVATYDPVCGCDGVTYTNLCEARSNGTNAASYGACSPVCSDISCDAGETGIDTSGDGCIDRCISDGVVCDPSSSDGPGAGCGEGAFCVAAEGSCGAEGLKGECVDIPPTCDDGESPVCGCDGTTYASACQALVAGVHVLSKGDCPACETVIECVLGNEPKDTDGDGCADTCVPAGKSCVSGDDLECGADGFCETFQCADGDGASAGVCVAFPTSCALVISPVCGCDDVTYPNDCQRRVQGVSKRYDGPCEDVCPGTPSCDPGQQPVDLDGDGCAEACQQVSKICNDAADCPSDAYCFRGACSGLSGTCVIKPIECSEEAAPVCGCDGVTYKNVCQAAAAGVDVASKGSCPEIGDACGGNAKLDCPAEGYCELPAGSCGLANAEGTCVETPSVCSSDVAPVCSCDGTTYANDCERQTAGAAKAYDGACQTECLVEVICKTGYQPVDSNADGCEDTCVLVAKSCGGGTGSSCGSGEICDPVAGLCSANDALGLCVELTDNCNDAAPEPVCGCDGETYPSDCDRVAAQVAKLYDGACVLPCPVISCPVNETAVDTDDDGCPDTCEPDGGCGGPLTCLAGSIALDTDGDGCKDSCVAGKSCVASGDVGICSDTSFCEVDAGRCEDASPEGVCVETPTLCDASVEPVCGCDGVTYTNDCERQAAGVAKSFNGSCGMQPTMP